jgi:CRP-like cAMP-binding protein
VQSLEPLLREHPFFRGLLPEDVAIINGCASNARFTDGAYLFREGEPAEQLFLIRDGAVALEVSAPGLGSVVVQTVHAGDVVGFSWLFPPHRWQFDARAVGAVRAFAFDGVCLRGKCERDPRLGFELMQRFAEIVTTRLQATRLQLLDVYGHARAG